MDFDADTYSVWIDEVQWVADRPMTVSGSNFNIIQIGSGSDCAAENHFSIDQIRVVDTLPQIPTQRTSWGNVRALFRD
jgi:ethanolamine ammonia-lyase large subunit